ncbi:MAG: hypothetical protein WC856_25845 [Methylococcaceae bacterium]
MESIRTYLIKDCRELFFVIMLLFNLFPNTASASTAEAVDAVPFLKNFKFENMAANTQYFFYLHVANQHLKKETYDNEFQQNKAQDKIKNTADAIRNQKNKVPYPKELSFDVNFLISDASYDFKSKSLCFYAYFKDFLQPSSGSGSSISPLSAHHSYLIGLTEPQDYKGFSIPKQPIRMWLNTVSFCIKVDPDTAERALTLGEDFKGGNNVTPVRGCKNISPSERAKIIRSFPGKVIATVLEDGFNDEFVCGGQYKSIGLRLRPKTALIFDFNGKSVEQQIKE